MNNLFIVFIALITFALIGDCTTLQGSVSQTAIDNSEEQPIPVAPQRPMMGTAHSDLFQGNVSGMFPALPLQLQQPQDASVPLQSNAQHEISAMGYIYHSEPPYRIIYIDARSDLYGKAHVGDRVLLVDGIDPAVYRSRKLNYGVEDTALDIVIWHVGRWTWSKYTIHRHPISWFCPRVQAELTDY